MIKRNLSVIIPVYNPDLNILIRCLKSVDNDKVDVILLDDGSKKEIASFLDLYSLNKNNVKVVHQENLGAAMARKNALNFINTEYFTFVDQDDISHIDNMLTLLDKMKETNIKIGNGRTICYLPEQKRGIYSRKWKKEYINFKEDKEDLNNVTCAFWDKIYHIDIAPTIQIPSTHTQYHDMEVVYPALIETGKMLHTNLPIYEYRMRSTSSCGIELSPTSSLGIRKLLESYDFMLDILKDRKVYDDYKEEIDSIIIKLLFMRTRALITNKDIKNKKEMTSLMLSIIESVVKEYKNNKYYKNNFKGAELNDYVSYLCSIIFIKLNKINSDYNEEKTSDLLDSYDKKIIIKR